MLIGGRENQNVVALSINSEDEGKNFSGKMTYAGEGPISITAVISTEVINKITS